MNRSIINAIKDHFLGSRYIDKSEIRYIVQEDSRLLFEGTVYRALFFEEEPEKKLSIINDICFTFDKKSMINFINRRVSDYPYIVIFKAVVKNSLDLNKAVTNLSIEEMSDDYSDLNENEILVSDVIEEEIIFSGWAPEFQKFIAQF